jgi:putative ABC transport system permease protein
MTKLFGIPIESLAIGLAGALALVLLGVAAFAVRNMVFLRLGVRNVRRRPGRSALIVAGSMLGTTIIAAALATGDTMSQTIRSSAIATLGRADEIVTAKGVDPAQVVEGGGTGAHYFSEGHAAALARAAKPTGLVAGVTPVITELVAVQDVSSRQNEPRVTLFASDPRTLGAFGRMASAGSTVSLGDLRPGEIYLNAKAADKLAARAGDTVRILAGTTVQPFRVRAVVRYDGGATADAGLLMPLQPAQRLLNQEGLIKAVFVANRGGVGATNEVMRALQPTLAQLGLDADNTKQEALRQADEQGAAFMSLFTTFGSFSVAAGILLIFLIFVMLAAERRGELGIARAVGTQRRHLVQMFLYEGLAYDLIAAAVGAVLGIVVAYGMVFILASAFNGVAGLSIRFSLTLETIVIAYAIGVLLTFAVVAFSAWRVSRMNIVSAVRNLPEPPAAKGRRRRWIGGTASIMLGGLAAASGISAQDGILLGFGVLLIVAGLVPILRAVGIPERAVYTGAGLTLVMWFVLPVQRWLFGDLKQNFSIFVLSGLAIVLGASWALVYNADALLGALNATLGRNRTLAPVLRMSMAYPLRTRFRTGVTLAMFTLVVFTLVCGAVTTGSFVSAANNLPRFSGGFDVRATTSPTSPITDMRRALQQTPGVRTSDVSFVSSESVLPVKAEQVGAGRQPETYLVHGIDRTFLDHTTYTFAAMASGYGSASAVWRALREHPGFAVVDGSIVPRRSNFNFGAVSKFRLTGFYVEDRAFRPVPVEVFDSQTGKRVRLTVIGVLSDTTPQLMMGLWTSQATLAPTFGARALPTVHQFALRPSVNARATAKKLESAFLANGMQADAYSKLLSDAVSASLTFDRLIEGFMGLGLIVGVAALGVISARSVVERRQQIGVLRAIGFRRSMVQTAFLLESSFIAVTSILVGTALGLAVSYNVIADTARQPSWSDLRLDVPWLTLAVIFLVVYAVALLTTLAPARRASHVYPAEALRYQ